MRAVSFALATSFILLAACGGTQSRNSDDGHANLRSDALQADHAVGSYLQFRLSVGDAAKVMHERHEGMENIGKNGKAINRELTGPAPNLALVQTGAAQIASLSKQASDWFPAGTGPEAGKTGAKPAIWQNPKDFSVKLHNFQVAAAAFNTGAASGDMPTIKARFNDLEGTCKACHDTYRSEMHH